MKDNWISVYDDLPEEGQIVDLWTGDQRRANYTFIRNYEGNEGNNFFRPVDSGISCIRIGTTNYTNATHWRPLPNGPVLNKKDVVLKKAFDLKQSIIDKRANSNLDKNYRKYMDELCDQITDLFTSLEKL